VAAVAFSCPECGHEYCCIGYGEAEALIGVADRIAAEAAEHVCPPKLELVKEER
jgi:hypothetical protein